MLSESLSCQIFWDTYDIESITVWGPSVRHTISINAVPPGGINAKGVSDTSTPYYTFNNMLNHK